MAAPHTKFLTLPIAVLREHRRDPHRVVYLEADEPPKQQVILHLLHQPSFGADREQDLDQAGSDQPFRRDGRAAIGGIEQVERVIEARQCVVTTCRIVRSGCRAGMRSARST